MNNTLVRSSIGEFRISLFTTLMNMLFSRAILPAVNTYLSKGFEIPVHEKIELKDPQIIYSNGLIVLQTDVTIKVKELQPSN